MPPAVNEPSFLFVFRDPVGMPDPTPEQLERLFAWMEGLKADGRFLAGAPLAPQPSRVLRGPRGARATDGPFVEGKEVVAGYMMITAADFTAAVRIAQGCPILAAGTSLEVRPVAPMKN
jgi:hypothetical protein